MITVRTLARPMLASMFVVGGVDALRNPKSKVSMADDVARSVADALPVDLPEDPEQLVKVNAGVQLGAGLMLATGRLPRLSALALAFSLVPTTVAGHRFWEAEDDDARTQQMIHFLKNVSMFGGLLLAALDTEGRPSVPYLAGRASRRAVGKAGDGAARVQATAVRAGDALGAVLS